MNDRITSFPTLYREVAVRTSSSFLVSLLIGLLRFGTDVFHVSHWSFQLVVYGFVYGLFLSLWRVRRRIALVFLLIYFFAESAFITGALQEHRALMVLTYFGLSAGAMIWFESLFLRSTKRSVARESLGLAVLMGLAYTAAALLSLSAFRILGGMDVDFLPNILGAATVGFLLGLGVGMGHAIADLPRVRRVMLRS